MKNNLFLITKIVVLSLLMNSCITQVFKPSPWVKDVNMSELNGRYYTKSEIKKTSFEEFQSHFLLLFNEYEDIENAYYVDLEFLEPNQLKISYLTKNGEHLQSKMLNFTMKKKRRYWEYYFVNEDIFIPFIYGKSNIDRVRIGKEKDNHLRVENYRDISGGILIIGGGFAHTSENKFYRYDEYPHAKPFQENNKWGVIKQGKIIIPAKYELTNIFEINYIKIKENGKYGLLDENGVQVLPPEYDGIVEVNKNLVPVFTIKVVDKQGIVNEKNEVIIPPIYDEATREFDGSYRVMKGNQLYKYDVKAQQIITNPNYIK